MGRGHRQEEGLKATCFASGRTSDIAGSYERSRPHLASLPRLIVNKNVPRSRSNHCDVGPRAVPGRRHDTVMWNLSGAEKEGCSATSAVWKGSVASTPNGLVCGRAVLESEQARGDVVRVHVHRDRPDLMYRDRLAEVGCRRGRDRWIRGIGEQKRLCSGPGRVPRGDEV